MIRDAANIKACGDSIDDCRFGEILIVTQFFLTVGRYQNETTQPNSKTEDVDNGIDFIL